MKMRHDAKLYPEIEAAIRASDVTKHNFTIELSLPFGSVDITARMQRHSARPLCGVKLSFRHPISRIPSEDVRMVPTEFLLVPEIGGESEHTDVLVGSFEVEGKGTWRMYRPSD